MNKPETTPPPFPTTSATAPRATPEGVRRREAQVSPGPSSSLVAARRIAERLGQPFDEDRLRPVAKAVHYGLVLQLHFLVCAYLPA